jgi:hypothetical protein
MPASGAAATAPDLGLAAARLRRVDWTEPGITRRRCGQGFCYLDPTGRRIADPAALERIRRLAIPPAWRDVWICPDPMGHLQAVGIDAAGRRQYRYHDLFRARRDLRKFDHMVAFASALPASARWSTPRWQESSAGSSGGAAVAMSCWPGTSGAGGSTSAPPTSTGTSSNAPAATTPPRSSAPGEPPCLCSCRWPRPALPHHQRRHGPV